MARKDRLVQVKINTKIKNKLLASYNPGSSLQKMIDVRVANHVDDYAPSDTTFLRKSVFVKTIFGLGRLIYTIYGKATGRNTWNDTTSTFQGAPTRGSFWVQRWWNGGGKGTLSREIKNFIRKRG